MSRNRTETHIHFVHCTATRAKTDIGVRTIEGWHTNRGIYSERGLTGYHYVVRRSGHIELGRDLPAVGAHVRGWNHESIGTCLVGGARRVRDGEVAEWDTFVSEDNFEATQKASLEQIHRTLMLIYPSIILAPHYAVSVKSCPAFDVWAWQRATFGQDDSLRFAEYKAAVEEEAD